MTDIKIVKFGSPIRFGRLGEEPALSENGMIYYDVSANLFKIFENGAWKALASRDYADAKVSGFDIKEVCIAATLSDLSATYNNGVSGVGATLTGTEALPTIDGQSLTVGSRVLVLHQSSALQNGIYTVTELDPFILTRATDFDNEVNGGEFVFVKLGSTYGACAFVCTNTENALMGSSAISFTQINGTARTLQQHYATGGQITTANGQNLIISGTEKLSVAAAGGVEIANNLSAGDTLLSSASISNALSVDAGQFLINSGGNINRLRNVSVSFPSSASQANYALANDGSGNLTFNNLAVSNLNDVFLTDVSNSEILSYDSETSRWINVSCPVSAGSQNAYIVVNSQGRIDTSFLQYHVNFGGNVVSGISEPTVSTDLANKAYPDSVTLQKLYTQDQNESGVTVTTTSAKGPLIVAGSQKLAITASGGLDLSHSLAVSGSMTASTLIVGNDSMSVSANGNLTKIKGIAYSFPASQSSGANYILANDASGNLSWTNLSIQEMSDVTITGLSDDQFLRSNGSALVNVSAITQGQASAILMSNASGRLASEALQYNINFGSHVLSNVASPIASNDCANKLYVDTEVSSASNGTGSLTLQTVYAQDTNGSDVLITTSSAHGTLCVSGSESLKVSSVKGFMLADFADASKSSKTVYKHGLSLSANQTAAPLSDLSFDITAYAGCIIKYRIKDTTSGASRVGTLLVSTDGTNTSIADSFTETSSLGVSWSIGITNSDVEIRYTTDSNAKTMNVKIKYFV